MAKWLVQVNYDEDLKPTLYLVTAFTEVGAIKATLNSDEWGPIGTIKNLEVSSLHGVEIIEEGE